MSGQLRPSRRQAIGIGLGALGIGAVAGQGVAAADDPVGGAAGGAAGGGAAPAGTVETASSNKRIEVAAPTTAGIEYVTYEGFAFQAPTGTSNIGNFGELATVAAGYFSCHLDIPNGATITEVVWYFQKSASSSAQCRLVQIATPNPASSGLGNSWNEMTNSSTGALSVSAGVVQTLIQNPVTVAPGPAIVDTSASSYLLIVNMPAGGVGLIGARVGFRRGAASATSFFPLNPGRVYDSRWPVFGNAKILLGQNRVVSVKDRRRILPDDGAVDLADFVPVGARAIAYNLTVTDTTGGGYLSVTPGDAATFSASTINWAGSGQSLANGTVGTLDAARTIKVFAGGTTHFLIDIVGYYA
jgi:hypothetical protein